MKVMDLQQKLKSHDPNDIVVGVVWTGEDIRCQGREMGCELTDAQVAAVADALYRKHDATIGICWGTIGHWIRTLAKDEGWVLAPYTEEEE